MFWVIFIGVVVGIPAALVVAMLIALHRMKKE